MGSRASHLCASFLLVTACGDSGGRGSDSATSTAPGTGLSTTLPSTDPTTQPTGGDTGTTSAGSNSESNSESNSNSSPVTSGTSEPGTKFDQGMPTPDFGVPGCGDSGGEPDTMFSYIWIANSGQGTVSKINTKTGVEEGRYYVEGGSPSRTSVNLQGDVAVSARDPGGVTKIASVPERCVDTNGNGVIDTSTGPADVRPKGTDECVLWFKPIPSPGYTYGPRATAWEGVKADPVTCEVPTPRLWFAWMDGSFTAHFMRVDGATGATLDEVTYQWPNGDGYSPYGGAVNAAGDFFATGLNKGPAVKVDAQTLQITDYGVAPGCKYGMTLDADGNIWNGGCIGGNMYMFDMQAQQWIDIGNAAGSRVNGVMADRDGNVWGAGSDPCRLVHVDAKTRTYINPNIPLPGCASPWGVSIDVDGYVWVVDMSANMAFKVDPDTYQTVLTVGGLINPYTYSDMTGAGLNLQVNPPG